VVVVVGTDQHQGEGLVEGDEVKVTEMLEKDISADKIVEEAGTMLLSHTIMMHFSKMFKGKS